MPRRERVYDLGRSAHHVAGRGHLVGPGLERRGIHHGDATLGALEIEVADVGRLADGEDDRVRIEPLDFRLVELGREALLAVEEENGIELAALRADAITRCIARDPKLARDFIDAQFDGEDQKVDWEPEMWLGINHEAFKQRAERREKDGRGK